LKVLGIDPGLEITGYGVIEVHGQRVNLCEAGVIRTSQEDKLQDRLSHIHDNLIAVISEVSPEVAIIEKLYSHYKHPATAILMGHVRGVVYLAIKKTKLALFEYPVKRVKKSVVGSGSATKEQVARMVQAYLGLKEVPQPLDVSDALALTIAHVFISKGRVNF
jgi:crossover junction endodeoxyribonuclease RuvC